MNYKYSNKSYFGAENNESKDFPAASYMLALILIVVLPLIF